jgi:mRNA interferase RelE/StbE
LSADDIQFTQDAWDDWCDLDRSAKIAVAKAIVKLESDPELRGEPLGRRKDDSSLTTFRKLRAGRNKEYRIVYRVDPSGTPVVIWVIGPRSDGEVYDMAKARLLMNSNPAVHSLIESFDELWNA